MILLNRSCAAPAVRLTQSGQTIHNVFDMHGNRIAEYDYDDTTGSSTLIREYVWLDGMIVAVVEIHFLMFITGSRSRAARVC